MAARPELLDKLADHLGPWTVSGPAQQICTAALRDAHWQLATRARLLADGERLNQLLHASGIQAGGTALYQWWPEERPEAFWQHMAERGIWVRLFTKAARGIRIGLPADEAAWSRLQTALEEWNT